MRLHRLRNASDFADYQRREVDALSRHWAAIKSYVPESRGQFTIPGYSYPAGRNVSFLVDFEHAGDGDIVWRERVSCPATGFNNRMRGALHIFDLEMEAHPDSEIYISEQGSLFYQYLSAQYPNVTGSEYLGEQIPFGATNPVGIRNESLCRLTFPDESFEICVSLDVFEHIPDYRAAFRECCRVLETGGRFFWSVPFVPTAPNNIVCAEMVDGQVKHVLPPQYHVDPWSPEGVLCFTVFGWGMLEQVCAAGFRDAYAVAYHSVEFGYLGGVQFMFVARK